MGKKARRVCVKCEAIPPADAGPTDNPSAPPLFDVHEEISSANLSQVVVITDTPSAPFMPNEEEK